MTHKRLPPFDRVAAMGFCVFALAAAGCATTGQNQAPMWSASNPHPDPQTEYRLAVQEYNQALEGASMASISTEMYGLNQSLGVYAGGKNEKTLGAATAMANIVSRNDAQRRVAAAEQRLRRAEATLGKHVHHHHHNESSR